MSAGWLLSLALLTDASSEVLARIHAEYDDLLAANCDPQVQRIATPIEARVLRNLPYALAGHRFQSSELARLFAQDGQQNSEPSAGQLGERDRACVARLARHERELRQQIPIDPQVEAVMIAVPEVFFGLRSEAIEPGRYRDAVSRRAPGEWSWMIRDSGACGGDGDPQEAETCATLSVICTASADEVPECQLIWAG